MVKKPKVLKKKISKGKKKIKQAKRKAPLLFEEEEEVDESTCRPSILSDLEEDEGDEINPAELLEIKGFSIGCRIGTILKLENLDDSALPEIARKAGFQIRLKGCRVSLVPEGGFLSLQELNLLAQWLLNETLKAAEDYDVGLD